MDNHKLYIDITGLYHLNKPGLTGVYRVEDEICRYISKVNNNKTELCTWESSTNSYYEVKYRKMFYGRSINRKMKFHKKAFSILLKVLFFVIANTFMWNIINLVTRLPGLKNESKDFSKIKKDWRSSYNDKIKYFHNRLLLSENDTLIIPSSAYISNIDYVNNLIQLSSKIHLNIFIFIYDMIPHYNTYLQNKYQAFTKTMEAIPKMDCNIITISEYSKSQITDFFHERKFTPKKIIMRPLPITFNKYLIMPLSIKTKINCKYALYVSTQGERKNHIFLIDLWLDLYNLFGNDIPNLIFIGKQAEASENINLKLNSLPCKLRDKVIILGSITDRELFFYYKNAWMTLFPSLYEGWGLPVSESHYFNKICICNTGSALDEASENLSDSISVNNRAEWLNRIIFYLNNDNELKEKEIFIMNNTNKSNWEKYFDDLFLSINKLIK